MTEEFQKSIRTQKLFSSGARVLLAVSGGVDSVVLCELFYRSGIPFAIAHCNFSLRGKESDADEAFVKRLAVKYKAGFHGIRFDTENEAAKNKLSIQEAARNLRYKWFETIRKENHFQCIATAHHVNDSIETFFINLLRGTGPDGLKGIPAKKGKVVRPLLFATRHEIEKFAGDQHLKWRHDSSNDSDDYLRNRIRQDLIPLLTRLQPSFEKTMQQNMKHIAETSLAAEEWTSEKMEGAFRPAGKGELKIDLSGLQEKWMEFLLYQFLKVKGFNRSQAAAMAAPSPQRESGRIFYADEYEALKDRDHLIIRKRKKALLPALKISASTKSIRLPSGTWKISRRKARSFSLPRDASFACLDASKIKFPLTVRHWKEGDAFYPLGMKGRKKVSDFLVDNKISLFGKETIFVILSGSEIISIPGYRIDERYKVTPETKEILIIEPTNSE